MVDDQRMRKVEQVRVKPPIQEGVVSVDRKLEAKTLNESSLTKSEKFGGQKLNETADRGLVVELPNNSKSQASANFQNHNYQAVESILEKDLGDSYDKMSLAVRQEFKQKGEEITVKIVSLLLEPKVKIKKIIALIREWLQLIPGINRFFLEQTAKIKADEIIIKTKGKM